MFSLMSDAKCTRSIQSARKLAGMLMFFHFSLAQTPNLKKPHVFWIGRDFRVNVCLSVCIVFEYVSEWAFASLSFFLCVCIRMYMCSDRCMWFGFVLFCYVCFVLFSFSFDSFISTHHCWWCYCCCCCCYYFDCLLLRLLLLWFLVLLLFTFFYLCHHVACIRSRIWIGFHTHSEAKDTRCQNLYVCWLGERERTINENSLIIRHIQHFVLLYTIFTGSIYLSVWICLHLFWLYNFQQP